MSELDLSEAVEAGQAAARQRYLDRTGLAHTNSSTGVEHYVAVYAEAAVRAAEPIIRRLERERIAAEMEAAFVTGAVAPEWAQAGGKPTARGIREWAVGIARGTEGEAHA